MGHERRWLLAALYGALGLLGLLLASRAAGGLLYWLGLGIFGLAVFTIFAMIRAGFDAAEGKPAQRREPVALALLLVGFGSLLFHVLSPWWWAPIASNWQYIDDTIDLTFWITGIVFLAIMLFMVYCALRFRHRPGHKAAYEPESTRLEIGLSAATAVGVAAMLAPGLFVWNQFVSVPAEAATVEAVGQQWNWSFRLPGADGRLGASSARHVAADNPLGLDPDDPAGLDDVILEAGPLFLPLDQPAEVLLRSNDVLHSFYVPEFRAKMDLVPGMVTRLWFTPTRAGRFQILCAELCGVAHANMRGEVVVVTADEYERWLAEQPTFAELSAPGRTELAGRASEAAR